MANTLPNPERISSSEDTERFHVTMSVISMVIAIAGAWGFKKMSERLEVRKC